MANNPHPLPEGYTKATIQLLKQGCEYYYPFVLPGQKDSIAFGQGAFGSWNNSSDFKKELFRLLPEVDDIKEVYKILENWELTAPDKPTPKEQLDRTTPENERLASMQEEAQVRQKAKDEADARAKEQTEAQIKALQEKVKGKVVYLEPKNTTKIKLTPEEELARANFEKAAADDPVTFINTFSEKILQSVPSEVRAQIGEEELKIAANQVAADFLARTLRKDDLVVAPTGLFKGLLESNLVPKELKEEALATLGVLSATSEGVTRNFLYPVVGKNLTDFYYLEPEKEYVVTERPTPNSTHRVDLENLQTSFASFKNNPVFGFLKDQAKEELVKHGKQIFVDYVAKLPTKGVLGFIKSFTTNSAISSGLQILTGAGVTYQATNLTGWVIQIAAPDLVPVITFAAQRFGVNIGLTTINALTPAAAGAIEAGAITGATVAGQTAGAVVAGAVAGEAAGVAAGAAGVAAGVGTGAAVGAAAATPTGPLALILAPIFAAVGAVVGKVLDKIKIWLKKNPNAIRNITLIGLIAAIAVGSVPLIFITGFLFVSTFIVGGGVIATGAAAGTFIVGAFTAIITNTIVSIAKPIVLSLIGIITFTAFVLFIINSGAYIVPPDTGSSINIDQNPYISVTKVADVTSTSNPPPSKTINYTVTVSAPQGSISNIVFQNGCTVLKEGATPTCSAPLPPETPDIIDPTSPFVFTYSQTYDASFSNSLVTDTFSVTATTPMGQGNSLSSASVIIGTPPTACFNVTGTNWPASRKANVLSAIGTMTGSFPAYTSKLCSGGTIKVVYDTSKNPGGWGYYSGGTLYFNGGGLDSSINALYIFAHETGHHFQSGTAAGISAMVQYLNNTSGVAQERPLCSYVNTGNPYEAFAEAIALYVTRDQSSQWQNKCGGTFQSTYPNHYNFARDRIF